MGNLGQKIKQLLSTVKPPFFDGLTLWDVLSFFFRGIYEGAISSRAGSVSFSFFLALFPGIIFIFTLIAYLRSIFSKTNSSNFSHRTAAKHPRHGFQIGEDILTIKRGGLLSITFVAALLFATNGTLSLIANLGISYHNINVKKFWSQYFSAFLLTIFLTLLILIAIVALIFSEGFTRLVGRTRVLTEYTTDIVAGRGYWFSSPPPSSASPSCTTTARYVVVIGDSSVREAFSLRF